MLINQLFGENKNALFYGPEGHTGIDINTQGENKYRRDDSGWIKEPRNSFEKVGRIPIVACHDGKTTSVLNDDKQKNGWGVYVTADPYLEGTVLVQYRTLYWHIESLWGSLDSFWGAVKRVVAPSVVKGQVIAIAGNNGMSTGPHLHLELQKRVKGTNGWSAWDRINPLPAFVDEEVLFAKEEYMGHSRYFYKGQEITKAEYERIKSTLLPVKQ